MQKRIPKTSVVYNDDSNVVKPDKSRSYKEKLQTELTAKEQHGIAEPVHNKQNRECLAVLP